MAVVIKPFSCSFDGVTSELLHPGDERDFGTMTDGLVAEGYISESKSPKSSVTETIVEPLVEKSVSEPANDVVFDKSNKNQNHRRKN